MDWWGRYSHGSDAKQLGAPVQRALAPPDRAKHAKRLTQREHVHAEVDGQLKDEVRAELRAGLQAEVREELAQSEVQATRRLAQASIERLNEEVARHQAKAATVRTGFYKAKASMRAASGCFQGS